MSNRQIENELLHLERQYWQAIKDKDINGVLSLTDDPCFILGATGTARISRDGLSEMMKNAKHTLVRFEIKEDIDVRMITPEVAIVVYGVNEELIVDGEPITIDVYESSTWVRRKGQWLCTLHTEALKGDAFGRDKKAA